MNQGTQLTKLTAELAKERTACQHRYVGHIGGKLTCLGCGEIMP